jgi:hypothetical protein
MRPVAPFRNVDVPKPAHAQTRIAAPWPAKAPPSATIENRSRRTKKQTKMGSNTVVLATGAAALIAMGVGLMAMGGGGSASSHGGDDEQQQQLTIREIDDTAVDGNGDYITEEDVTDVFDKLFLEAQNQVGKIMQQLQQLQRMGQSLPEAQVQAVLHNTLTEAIVATQTAVLAAKGIDEDCFEEATWEFVVQLQNRNVTAAVQRLQRLWQSTTGEPVVGWTPGQSIDQPELLSADETILAAQVYYTALTQAIKDVVAQFKNDNRKSDLSSPAVQQELNMAIGTVGSKVAEDALLAMHVSQVQFEASVKAHQDNEQVARALTMLSMKQQQELQSIGI